MWQLRSRRFSAWRLAVGAMGPAERGSQTCSERSAAWQAGSGGARFPIPLNQREVRPSVHLTAPKEVPAHRSHERRSCAGSWGWWVSVAPLPVAGRLVRGSLYRINAVPHSCLIQKKSFCWIQL